MPELSPLAHERLAYRRSRARRSTLVALVSTVVFAAVVAVGVTSTPGWPRVQATFLDPAIAWSSLPAILEGLWLNIRVLVVTEIGVLALGLLIAVLRTLRGPVFFPLRALATGYVDLFRGVPLLIALYLIGFGVPALRLQGVPTSAAVLGTITLVLVYSAYVAEVFRAGIESIHPSPAGGGALARAHPPPVDAAGDPPPGRPAGAAAAAQRLRRAAEGRRADLGARRGRRDPGRADRVGPHVQLHAVRGGGGAVHPARGADRPDRGRRGGPGSAPAGPGMTAVLEVRGLVKRYGDTPVLRGVDLTVEEHRVVTLIGSSGSGKSTLLRCVDLLEEIDDGQVLLDGVDVSDPRADVAAAQRRMGIVFQAFNLFPHMTVLQNVTLAPRVVHGVGAGEAEDRARELLGRVGLEAFAGAHPDRLSGGQQQRVAIARALAVRPRLLLLDEITSALDPELVGEVLAIVRELAASGMTILMATHEMGFAKQVADTVCFLDGGRVLESGPPAQVLGDPLHERTRRFLTHVVEAGRLT